MTFPWRVAPLALVLALACGDGFAQANPAERGARNFRFAQQEHTSLVSEVVVAGASPFASTCGDRNGVYIGAEVEPHIAVDPLNANHLVGAWQQDRYQDGGSRGHAWGVSFDGASRGLAARFPITPARAARSRARRDPWATFAPDGTAYQIALAFNGRSEPALRVRCSFRVPSTADCRGAHPSRW